MSDRKEWEAKGIANHELTDRSIFVHGPKPFSFSADRKFQVHAYPLAAGGCASLFFLTVGLRLDSTVSMVHRLRVLTVFATVEAPCDHRVLHGEDHYGTVESGKV